MAQTDAANRRALDRFNIDGDSLTGAPVWAVPVEEDVVYLFQEDDRDELRARDHAVLHADGEDRIVGIEPEEGRFVEEGIDAPYNITGHVLRDIQTGEELDFVSSPPDPEGERWTPLDMVN